MLTDTNEQAQEKNWNAASKQWCGVPTKNQEAGWAQKSWERGPAGCKGPRAFQLAHRRAVWSMTGRGLAVDSFKLVMT